MISFAPADPTDVNLLHLRKEDAEEVSEGWREACAASLDHWEGLAAWDDDSLVALGGVVVTPQEVGVWLLCSDRVKYHKRGIMRAARDAVEYLREEYPDHLIYNYIPKSATSNRRFIEALGFRILPSPQAGFDFFYLPQYV